jgi:16S rRNA (cytosine967-C5)-methyltransferase
VLRNALRQWDALIAACDADEVARLRHPRWWIDKLRDQAGDASNWRAQIEAANTHPPMSLRVNRRRGSLEAAVQALNDAGHETRPLAAADRFALHMTKPVPVGSLPGYAEGLLSVQDWGAQQAGFLLDVKDGQRVLDACAAPGGKTAHLLELADLRLTALDADPARLRRVEEQLTRLGLSAELKPADCRVKQQWWDGQAFDRILADVPCSASGVARRHPDIKWLRTAADVARFATQQAEILEALWPTLAAGGKMLYVTCSIFAEENGLQIARFASRHADCQRVALPDGQLEAHWLPGPEHDGFYFALLQKLD